MLAAMSLLGIKIDVCMVRNVIRAGILFGAESWPVSVVLSIGLCWDAKNELGLLKHAPCLPLVVVGCVCMLRKDSCFGKSVFRAWRINLFFLLGLIFCLLNYFSTVGNGREFKWIVVAVACEWLQMWFFVGLPALSQPTNESTSICA